MNHYLTTMSSEYAARCIRIHIGSKTMSLRVIGMNIIRPVDLATIDKERNPRELKLGSIVEDASLNHP